MKKTLAIIAVVGLALLLTGPVGADDGFYVVVGGGGVGTKITSLPYEIKNPGFYYLCGNLTAASGGGITISSGNVTLDLMGFALSGNTSHDGISVSEAMTNVEVRNGTLTGWQNGIYSTTTEFNIGNLRILNIRALHNTQAGVNLSSGYGSLVKGCSISNCSIGIGVVSGTVSGNVIENCTNGISTYYWTTISGNVLESCGTGILAAGSIIGNTIRCDTGQTAISLWDPTSMLDQNTVVGDGTHYTGGGTETAWGTNAGR